MIEEIKKFNLELFLFQKDLDSYIQNSNETDNETTKLMNTIILGLDRLQHNSKFHDQHMFNDNQFAHDLNDEIFERRRIIVCLLCSEQISLDSKDFESHIKKRSHKEAEAKRLKTKSLSPEIDRSFVSSNDVKSSSSFHCIGQISGSAEKQSTEELVSAWNTCSNVESTNNKSVNEIENAMMMRAIQSAKKLSANRISSGSNLSLNSLSSMSSTAKTLNSKSSSPEIDQATLVSSKDVKLSNSIHNINWVGIPLYYSATEQKPSAKIVAAPNCNANGGFSHIKSINEIENTMMLPKKLSANRNSSGSNLSLNSLSSINSSLSLQSLKTAISHIENTNVNSPQSSTPAKLENIIKIDDVYKQIPAEMNSLLSRPLFRVQHETQIISKLSFYFSIIDSKLRVIPFGSSTFGFGAQKTNFNILIKTDGSNQQPDILLNAVQESLKISGLQQDFDLLGKISANRAQSQQLKLLHKESRIECLLQFDGGDSKVEESSEIIRIYMNLHPICKELITLVKAWNNIVNKIAAENGLVAFQFNTYIISVFVLFFLQMNYNFPTVKMLSETIQKPSCGDICRLAMEFFELYRKIEISKHLISLNVGKWQERELQQTQKNFSPEQKRLREGIAIYPENWKNCSIFVQDLVSPGLNIAAEITKQEITNFKLMCKLFSSCKPTLKLERPIVTKTIDLNLKQGIHGLIDKELVEMRRQLDLGLNCETEITSILTKYIHQFKPTLKVIPFGSNQYGFKRRTANFNLLIDTGGEKPKDIGKHFFYKLDKTDIHSHFEHLKNIAADRTLRRQYSLTHKKIGVECLLLFESDSCIVESSNIIGQYVNKEPMCRFLITYISAWQTVLNKSEPQQFQFNTYIISVLVIFFLQRNYNLPTVDKITNFTSNPSSKITDFKELPREFFALYGNSYQMWNHVISAHIGRWQERRVQASQTHYPEAKQRLRNGIETSPENWTDCAMYIQDLVRPNINIAAEIPTNAAENFQKMCQNYAKIIP